MLAISSNGLYFYITQLPIRPNSSDLSLVLDQTFGLILLFGLFGLILKIRLTSGLILKITLSVCHDLKNLCVN